MEAAQVLGQFLGGLAGPRLSWPREDPEQTVLYSASQGQDPLGETRGEVGVCPFVVRCTEITCCYTYPVKDQ